MKVFISMLLMMLVTYSQVFAIAPLNEKTIKEAQKYGIDNAKVSLGTFLKPWLSYEETSTKLDDSAEMAYVYTTYLLIATDARDNRINNKKVEVQDSEKIIVDYIDTLSFSIKLLGDNAGFAQSLVAVIEQGDNSIKAVKVLPQTAIYNEKTKKYMVQGFVYFKEDNIDINKPIKLVVGTNDNKHCFYFDLAKVN